MMTVDGIALGGLPKISGDFGTEETKKTEAAGLTADTLPAAGKTFAEDSLSKLLEGPSLPPPGASLSLDNLLQAISNEARRQGLNGAVSQLETYGEELKQLGDEKLAEMQKQLEEMRKQETANGFLKAFRIIGAIVGAIASVATVAVGCMTANPCLIAAGALGFIGSADAALSAATDGKVSISAGLKELGTAMGMSEESAAIFSGVLMAVGTVVSIGLSFGSAAVTSSGKMAETITAKAAKHAVALGRLAKAGTATQIASGVVTVGTGASGVALACINHAMEEIKAHTADIDALLEEQRELMKMMEEFVEKEMDAANALISDVKDIVEDCNQTATTVLTATPAVA